MASPSEHDPGESPIEGEVLHEYEQLPDASPVHALLEYHREQFLQSMQILGIALFALFVAAGLVAIMLLTDFSTLGTILLIVWSIVCIPLWFVGKAFFHYQAMRYLSRLRRR